MSFSGLPNSQSIQIPNRHRVDTNHPIIPFIPGDGVGREIWETTRMVVDAAIQSAYGQTRKVDWKKVYAGEEAYRNTGDWLPAETLNTFERYKVGIKGPLTTPIGKGIRSLNVALRKDLDLYVCLRPIRHFTGIQSPVRQPEKVDITIFRENTEDLYSGIEFAPGSADGLRFLGILEKEFPELLKKIRFKEELGIGIKPISKSGTERLVRAAVNYAIINQKRKLTFVHKGNIMKFTEGAFCSWGYDLVEREFGNEVFTNRQWAAILDAEGEEAANLARNRAAAARKTLVDDVLADAAFQRALLEPELFDVIATTNLNGDYLTDALAAQIGGIGISPGANINFESGVAIFESTHGTAPTLAGQNKANPSSLILSAEMMLRYLGWTDAANLLINALSDCIKAGEVTQDLSSDLQRICPLGTHEFGLAICSRIQKPPSE